MVLGANASFNQDERPWTSKEYSIFADSVKKYGKKWNLVAEQVNRSYIGCRNYGARIRKKMESGKMVMD